MSTGALLSNSPLRVAQYLRASTELQEYSTFNQGLAIAQYATHHNLQIVQTYVDEARSGLGLKNREGLRRLLRDVMAGSTPYKMVLVYDVSRWGRFLDTDESAHYEYLCKSAGVPVHYCAESFGNEPTLPNLMMKAVKRTMAGEYSRELSAKVTRGLQQLVRRGFRSGGPPGYGLRRLLLAADGSEKQHLKPNERKSLASDRVVYELGPQNEVQCVRDIYAMFVEQNMSCASIVRALNARAVPIQNKYGRWLYNTVRVILSHPKYTGALVYNRTSRKLQGPCHNLPKSEWIIIAGVFEGIVDNETYQKAQAIRFSKIWNRTNAELLDRLRTVLTKTGGLSTQILSDHPEAPSASTCRTRFGSLGKACALVGYRSPVESTVQLRTRLQSLRKELMAELAALFPQELSVLGRDPHWRTWLRHKSGLKVCVRVCRSVSLPVEHGRRWAVEPYPKENGHVTLLALLDTNNAAFEQLFLLPRIPYRGKVTVGLAHRLFNSGIKVTDQHQFLLQVEAMKVRRRQNVLEQTTTQVRIGTA